MYNFAKRISYLSKMKQIQSIIGVFLLSLVVASCGTVPMTGRRSLNLVSDEEVLASSHQQYYNFVRQARGQGIIVNDPRIMQISQRLIQATNTYLRNNNHTDLLNQMQWEVNVVNSKQVNAFCMPGGKIVVYTGLANLIGNGIGSDAELAAVIGHEIAHAIAKHANERLSNAMLQNLGGQILGEITRTQSTMLSLVLNQAYGLGSQVFVALPFGRKQELEADHIGLIIMAMAGYDPNYAISLWQKMTRNSGGSSNDFLSTHPNEERRIEKIREALPKVLKYYKASSSPSSTPSKITQPKTKGRK